jgi:hypothetical protein
MTNITLRSTCSVALAPVDDEDRPAGGFGHQLPVAVDLIGMIDIDLDRRHVASPVEIGLRLGERHVDEAEIVFRHSDLEDAGDLVGLDARRHPHGRHRAARRHQRDAVADLQRQLLAQAFADQHPLPVVESLERSALDVVGDGRQLGDLGGAHAAHQHAAGGEG